MTGVERAVHLLRERAQSYARDAERLAYEQDSFDGDELVLLAKMRDELRRVADEVEAEIADKPKWSDLLGIDPDYTDGVPVDEFVARNRGHR